MFVPKQAVLCAPVVSSMPLWCDFRAKMKPNPTHHFFYFCPCPQCVYVSVHEQTEWQSSCYTLHNTHYKNTCSLSYQTFVFSFLHWSHNLSFKASIFSLLLFSLPLSLFFSLFVKSFTVIPSHLSCFSLFAPQPFLLLQVIFLKWLIQIETFLSVKIRRLQ